MPTVLRSGPYAFFFYSADWREPAHIHVRREERRAKIWLVPVQVSWNGGFRPAELRRILRIVKTHQALLLRSWHEHFASRDPA